MIFMRFFLLALASTLLLGAAKPRVAFIHKGSYLDFWIAMETGARKAANELGVDLQYKGSPYADNTPAQIKLVDTETNQGFDAIVLAPTDRTELVAPVSRATAKGVKVIIVDSPLAGAHHLAYIGTDNEDAGRRAAKTLANLVSGKGKTAKVLVLRLVKGSGSTDARAEGFLAEIAKSKDIEVIADAYAGPLVGSAHSAMKELLAKHRNLDGIFCVNESTALGALMTLRELGLNGKIRFVGFDSGPRLMEALNADDIDALIVQDPVQIGYLGVKAAVAALRKEPLERVQYTDVKVLTKSSLTH